MSLTGLLFMICCSAGFDGCLGGVMGILCTVVFGVLSSFVNFIWDGILGMKTCGSNSFCFFFKITMLCYIASSSFWSINFFLELVHFVA